MSWSRLYESGLTDNEFRISARQVLEIVLRRLECDGDVEKRSFYKRKFIETLKLKTIPIALHTDKAKEQHYEVPTDFFLKIMGPWMKYSSCYWNDDIHSIKEAEEAMLRLTCERAQVEDGHHIMDLGCGWGSVGLWVLEHYPNCHVTALSNSDTQQAYIQEAGRKRGFSDRLQVISADINYFDTHQVFDRIISIEMFEHMKNYQELFQKVASWLKRNGKLFLQILSHKEFVYSLNLIINGQHDWMAENFFTGGTIPSSDLYLYFQEHVLVSKMWQINGQHYQKTLDTWLRNQDKEKHSIIPIFERHYGTAEAEKMFENWRKFFMYCSELFGFREGNEWILTHILFEKQKHFKSNL